MPGYKRSEVSHPKAVIGMWQLGLRVVRHLPVCAEAPKPGEALGAGVGQASREEIAGTY